MALSTDKQVEELNELIRFDFDAVGAYNEAIDHVKEEVIKEPLKKFRADHERHILETTAIVRRLGGKPVDRADFKGFVRKTMTRIAGLVGVESVMQAMKSNAGVLNKAYAHHATLDFPPDIQAIIKRNFGDKQRHLEWIDQALRTRIWESGTAHP